MRSDVQITPLLVVAVLALSSCATDYQSTGFTGGYSETRLAPDVFRVRFSGNGYTSSDRAEDFTLLRASDLTLNNGFSYFAIVTGGSSTAVSSFNTGGSAITTGQFTRGGGYVGSTLFIPGQTVNIFKPRVGMLIKCFPSKPQGIDVFDARFLRSEIRRKYQLDKPQ